ncbi:MAG: hypothetical protein HDS31_08490, partial [Bacteroides sp.]|nr:hypothetical protein [Bacteroides sp.]
MALWFYGRKTNQRKYGPMVLWSKNQPKKIWPYGSMVEKVKNPTKVKYGTYGSMVEKVKNPTKVKYGTYGSMVEKV